MTTAQPTTHYHVQKRRRAEFLDDWRKRRRTGVIRASEVELRDTPRGTRVGVYAGIDGGTPMRTNDALVHEVDPGVVSTAHRHSWDAILFVVSGSGWTEIDGVRHDWKPWDALHLPAWAWHRHGNDGDRPARFLSFSSEPLLGTLNLALLEEAGDGAEATGRPPFSTSASGDGDPYSTRVRRLAELQREAREARVHTAYDDIELKDTPRGTRTAFLVDESIGYRTSGLTAAMFQLAPGQLQTMHRHPGEAFLYVVEGRGRSYIDPEPEGGASYEWEAGDIIVVDHFLWHQHFNDDPDRTARLVRVHMFASLLETMRALADPLVLFEERPEDLARAPDISGFEWPPDERPPS
jgi:quercetin dioxygenase-like cupin family protein